MPTYTINSPTIIFNHAEYGSRLLFKQGVTNPRDELGKNGVTLHGQFSSLFYKTIRINTTLIDEKGAHKNKTLNINRNSLIKYIGHGAKSSDSDQVLINKLNASLWTSDLNQPSREEDKKAQSDAGENSLRHAGQHNKRLINHLLEQKMIYLKQGKF